MIATKLLQNLANLPAALASSGATAPVMAGLALVGGAVGSTLVRTEVPVRTEVEDLAPFTGIEVWDLDTPVALNVHANLPQRVTVETTGAPDGISVSVRGDTLVIGGEADQPVSVSVTLTDLHRLVLWGDTDATVRAIHGPDFAVMMADTASLEAEGAVQRLEVVVDAHGQARLRALSSEEARVTASGASRVDLSVQSLLTATAIGGAGVFYVGNPEVKQVVHGAARVSPTNP